MSSWGETAAVVAGVLSRGGDHTVAEVVRVIGPPVRLAAVAVVLGALRELGLVEAHGGDGQVMPSSWRWRRAGPISDRQADRPADRPADRSDDRPDDRQDDEAVTRAVVDLMIRSPGRMFDARWLEERIGGPTHRPSRAGLEERRLRGRISRSLDRLMKLGVIRVATAGALGCPHYGWGRSG